MFEDLNTKVHSVRELVAWLDEHKGSSERGLTGDHPGPRDAWDPEATGIMQAPQLDRMLAHEQAQANDPDPASVSGSLQAFHVVELLQALSSGVRTGVLELMDGGHFARVHLDCGRIAAASFDDDTSIPPLDALKRAAAMQGGEFRFGPEDHEPPSLGSIVTLSTVQVLIELSTVAWELAGGEEPSGGGDDFNLDAFDDPAAQSCAPAPVDLPPVPTHGSRPLRLPDPLVPRLRDLRPEELDVLQATLLHRTLDATVAAIGASSAGARNTDGSAVERKAAEDSARDVVRQLLARGYLVG